MPRTARLTDALRGRGKTLAVTAAAAATLAGAGTASAAALTAGPHAGAPDAAAAPAARSGAAPHAKPGPATGTSRPRTVAAHTPARPYQIYDSVTPSAIPAHHEIATYADGGYAVAPSQVAGHRVLWIDTQGTDPRAAALDVEPGDATPSQAASWTWHKLRAAEKSVAIIYTMRSEWPAVRAAVNTLPGHMRSQVRWWIADPTGTPHVVRGASATQWYWGSRYDITTADPGF